MTAREAPARPVRFAALTHRNFTLLWVGLLVSNAGTWMQNVANGLLIFKLSGNSPLWLGYLGLSFALPMTIVPLFSGTIVDRVHRIRLLYVTQTGMMLVAFALAGLYWSGMLTAPMILVASFVGSVLLAFDNPARQALVPDLVPREHLLNALSLNAASYNGAAAVGPAIAGILYGPLTPAGLYALNGVSFLAVIFALMAMTPVPTHSGHTHAPLWESLKTGFRFTWRNRLVRILLMLSAVAAIFGRSYQTLLPAFVHIYSPLASRPVQAVQLGYLLSAAGLGALVSAFGLASRREVRHQSEIMVGSGLVFSISLGAFAVTSSLWVGIVLMFVVGVASTVLGTIIGTYIQIETPPELRGRVMSFYSITLIGLPSLGALFVGALAEYLGGAQGAPRAVLYGAIVLTAILLATARPILRARIDEPEVVRGS